MSSESNETAAHIECVDVNGKVKENGSIGEANCDSGLDTIESCSVAMPPSSNSEVSPVKNFTNDSFVDSTPSDDLDNESSLSPLGDDNSATEQMYFEYPKNENVLSKDINDLSISNASTNVINSVNSEESINLNSAAINCMSTNMSSISKNLATSTVSLTEPNFIDNSVMNKSPFSRSAENISYNENNEIPSINCNDNKINPDKILSEFTSQKTKASAIQKIPENTTNIDARYSRIPKESLSQDIGSIVKNVHGIFSSVSGSLKNAYTHRTVQKPIKPTKALPNGKLMNDIFEDEGNDSKIEPSTENTTYNLESVNNLNSEYTLIKVMESDSSSLESGDTKTDILKLQVESLERLLAEQRKENTSLRERVKQQSDELQQKDQTFKDLESKLDSMGKRVEHAEREKDAAVMRYASVECAAIEARRAADAAAGARKQASVEVELLNNKLKGAHAEKQRICQMYDDKCHELMGCERELAKIREEFRELEGRLKWTQSKLRVEMDAYKESSERAEKLSQRASELEAGREAAAALATDTARANRLEAELKESRAALILCRHERDELQRRLAATSQQLEAAARARDHHADGLAAATALVEKLQMSVLRLEEEAAELAALRARAALADTLSAQLRRESERASLAEQALSAERAVAETCGRREAAALDHAARLTADHVAQRAAAANLDAQARALSEDNASLRERAARLEAEGAALTAALADETDRRNKENRQLARKVAELTEELSDVTRKLEWENGENGVLKKKHASAIKELNRELQRALKRCEQLEAKLPPPDAASTRTGSVTSLSSGESAPHEDRPQNGHSDAMPDIQVREPDRRTLIERIVSLQRAAARRAERAEFLEEHARQLTAELRAKSRLLRHLLAAQPAGALAAGDRDANKKEIARLGGGAMAAVWGGAADGLSPELSLEMTRRLQAVLEDALLKNITLKENMETLGAEISRLKEQLKANESK